ncbi:DUF6215 domain-containing protein [Streptomyces sp. SID161]|uniref:DUF6215 domain-containing protein n=1 Tax=Streptomyces sp. SID161 TaxID=2690251 RepID=UPI00136CD9E2|nr:DUF6215 domain-containing protein [Streptomyces sp. SID161]MYW44791.1 hypothetical protein [Streptomyces sp. SID161]
MLGFLIRRLPFWVREPLLIVIGSVLGIRILYLAVQEHERLAAGLGVVFLVFTAVRVHSVVQALRARRNTDPAASADGVAVDAAASLRSEAGPHTDPAVSADGLAVDAAAGLRSEAGPQPRPQYGSGPRPVTATARKEPNAWAQGVAAVAVFGAIAAALFLLPRVMPSDDSASRPASCSSGEHEELPRAYQAEPGAVTGQELCEALNRPDLAQLLGTPGETATAASGSDNTAPLSGGRVAQPEAEVRFDTYTVKISATYDELSVAQYVKLKETVGEKDIKTVQVLGRPGAFSSDHTLKLTIDLSGDGSAAPVDQGPLARTLSVALDRTDRGGSYDITVWSESGALPDDAVLRDIAEKILPTIPERSA